MSEQISTRQIKHSEVTLEFTRGLQTIALEAWTAGLKGIRDPAVVKKAFDPDNPILAAEALVQYKAFARHGKLVVASEGKYGWGPSLGFAMARNDVSPSDLNPTSIARRSGKRLVAASHKIPGIREFTDKRPNRVYAKEGHVAVRPDAPKGTGTALVRASLQGFRVDQKSTAYIDDENVRSRTFFEGLGYEWDGKIKKPVYRFSEDNDPTHQRRYIAPVTHVIGAASLRLAQIGVDVYEREV